MNNLSPAKNRISKILKVELALPLTVAILSTLNLLNVFHGKFTLSQIVSIAGLIGVVLYFLRNPFSKYLFYFWILFQIVVIESNTTNQITGIVQKTTIWNMSQIINLLLGFDLGTRSHQYFVSLNLVPLIYFSFYRLISISSLKGKRFKFSKFRENNKLGNIFPLEGTVVKRVQLSNEKDWLLVQLETSFLYLEKEIKYVLIKPKDGTSIKQNSKQLIYLRLVYDIDKVSDGVNDIHEFPFVDWVICE